MSDSRTRIRLTERELLDLINTRYIDFCNGNIDLLEYLDTISAFNDYLRETYYE